MAFVLWPLLAALFMVFIGAYSVPTFDDLTVIMGVGGILTGAIPLLLARRRRESRPLGN